MDMLTAEGLEASYEKGQLALKDIHLKIKAGTVTVLLGQSGSGKSTLLSCLAGLQRPSAGSVTLDGKGLGMFDAKSRAETMAFVGQDYDLFPHMKVIDNVTHPTRKVLGASYEKALSSAEELLEQLGIAHLAERYPHQLSGGQKQRVGIARALAMGSKLLLLDEPSSALDPHSTQVLANVLKTLCQDGITIVLSTHDMDFAAPVMDEAIILKNGEITGTYEDLEIDALELRMA